MLKEPVANNGNFLYVVNLIENKILKRTTK